MNIWEILGIEPGAEADAIRIAYSTKVKAVHPEDDPDGFMRLRAAYKAALQISAGKPPDFDVALFTDDRRAISDEHGLEATSQPDMLQDIEKYADELRAKEESIADGYIDALAALRDSSDFDNFDAWKELLSGPDFDKLMRSEYFTGSFFEFLRTSRHPFSIPEDIRDQLLIPLIGEWRSYWQGSDLSGNFNTVWRWKLVKDSERIPDTILSIHSASIFISAALGLLAMIAFRLIVRKNDSDAIIGYFHYNYYRLLGWTMMLAITVVVCVVMNAACFFLLRRYVKERSYAAKKEFNSMLYLIIHVFIILIISFFLPRVASRVPQWGADLQQVKEGSASSASVYISANDRRFASLREIDVVVGDRHRYLKLLPGLDFNPGSERRQYSVAYTDKLGIIVSITGQE
ncbi:MAG: J domain-containing protein [Oscillospiraceae bacterium]|nr:J domain-containing protein [Oscillospiraceae bacterium]